LSRKLRDFLDNPLQFQWIRHLPVIRAPCDCSEDFKFEIISDAYQTMYVRTDSLAISDDFAGNAEVTGCGLPIT